MQGAGASGEIPPHVLARRIHPGQGSGRIFRRHLEEMLVERRLCFALISFCNFKLICVFSHTVYTGFKAGKQLCQNNSELWSVPLFAS